MQTGSGNKSGVRKLPRTRWFERFLALVAIADLGWVVFDQTYTISRNFYLRELPVVTALYDPLKGIEPHRDTQHYLDTVNSLETQLTQTGLRGPQVEPLLEDLRQQSAVMVDEDPFRVANKSGTLEKIKNRIRSHIGNESSKQSFSTFWSQAHLEQAGWSQELSFFNREIRPLIETNYFRHIGENSEPIDRFWQIDLFFISFFGVEFLVRTFYLSRRYREPWLDTMFWRWYDIPLLLPFWRGLRVIPVLIRAHQVGWLNLSRVQAQISHGLAANLAAEVTDLVFVGTINQIKSSIQSGEIARSFLRPRRYVEINDVNEGAAITTRLIRLVVYQVLPKVKPDIEALLRHNIAIAFNQSPLYQGLQQIPAVSQVSTEVTEQLVARLYQALYDSLTTALEDAKGGELLGHLGQHFSQALGAELQQEQTLSEIQLLLLDLLEEVKLTYLQHPTEEDLDQTLAEVAQVRQTSDSSAPRKPPRAKQLPPGSMR